jgi:hypothetical protein
MHQCIKFILFWNDTLHVSDGLSAHHQEFKIVHTATDICQTDTAVWQMLVAVCTVLNSWWWTERPSETCTAPFQNKNKFDKLVQLVGFAIEIYYDARPCERQTSVVNIGFTIEIIITHFLLCERKVHNVHVLVIFEYFLYYITATISSSHTLI